MVFEEQLQGLADLYAVTSLPMLLFDREGTEIHAIPPAFSGLLEPEFLREAAQRCDNCVLTVSWDSGHYSAAGALGENIWLMTAPASIMARQQGSMHRVLSHWVRPQMRVEFLHFLSEVPAAGQHQLVTAVNLCRRLWGSVPLSETKHWSHSHTPLPRKLPRQYHSARPGEKHSVHYEVHLAAAIESGDPEALQRSYQRPMDGYVGRMSLNDLQQTRYYFICCMYISSRAAARGGAPMELCLQLSDRYCQSMDNLTRIDAILELMEQAQMDFCLLAREHKEDASYALSTRQSLAYIEQHLFDPIRMEQLSAECGLNRRSISQYFRQDMGCSIPDYVNRRRVKEAAALLRETQLSLGQIAHLLQYSSQSYLGKLFSEVYGMTMLQYRSRQ